MAHDVFISHSAKDRTTANAICATLEAKGIRCWVAPRDVLPGRRWAEAIVDAIEEARVMVLVFSSSSNGSQQVWSEVEVAVNAGVDILPFRIEDVPLTKFMQFHIANRHWLDALTPPLRKHLKGLAEKVEKLLSTTGEPEQVAVEVEAPEAAGTAEPTIDEVTHRATSPADAYRTVKRWGSRHPAIRLAVVLGAAVGAVAAILVLVVLLSGGGDNGSGFVIFPSTPEGSTSTLVPGHPTSAATAPRPSTTAARTPLPSPTPSSTSTSGTAGPAVERSPKLLWRSEIWTPGVHTSPAVADGVVYFAAHDQNVYALDAATGEERWRFQTGGLVYSSPAVVEGVLYIGSNDGYVYALDAASGAERWRFQTGSYVFSSPTVVDGVVYIGSDDQYVYALDATTGEKRWRFKTDGDINSAPAVADGVVYVTGCDGVLYALDAVTGQERWRVGELNCIFSSPAVVDKVVYIAPSLTVLALDAATGEERWLFTEYLGGDSDPAVVDGVLYIGDREGYVYALDASTGEQLWRVEMGEWVEAGLETWRFEPSGEGLSSPAVADGVVYIGSDDNSLYALEAATGEQLWRFEAGFWVRSRPAVVDSVVYFGSVDGYVYALDASAGE